MKSPGTTPAMRQRAASANIAVSAKRSVSCACLAAFGARTAKEGYSERLGEAGGGERGREREQRADRRRQYLQHPGRQLRTEQDGLKRQPFGDEAVERRQSRDGGATDEKRQSRPGHIVNEAPQMLHVAFARRRQHGARAEEQQALEERMVERVQQSGRHRQRRGRRHAEHLERQREAKSNEDDADVLDRMVGEQALEVVLHQRVEHAEQRGAAPRPSGPARSTTSPPGPPVQRRSGRSHRPRPSSSPRSSARRHGSARRGGRAAARRAAARSLPSSRRRSAPGGRRGRRRPGVGAGRAHRVKGVAAGRTRRARRRRAAA